MPPVQVEKENIDVYLPRCLAPKTLGDFGYAYLPDGTLRHVATQTPFKFISQKHYDILGNAVVEELYSMMEGPKMNLRRYQLPLGADPTEEPTCPIFASTNANDCDTAVLICQGSGAVRPGMWARALCMNDTLDRGSVFPYIHDAQSRGWGVLVLNPNENLGAPVAASEGTDDGTLAANATDRSSSSTGVEESVDAQADPIESVASDASDVDAIRAAWADVSKEEWAKQTRASRADQDWIRDSEAPEQHMITAYTKVLPALFPNIKRLFIVAHSYGGRCVTALVRSILTQKVEKGGGAEEKKLCALVPAIALTDAINDLSRKDRKSVKTFMQQRAVNWVASSKPLDYPMPMGPEKSLELSAGHTDHIHTSESCRTSVMSLFDHISTTVPVGGESVGAVSQHCTKLSTLARSGGAAA